MECCTDHEEIVKGHVELVDQVKKMHDTNMKTNITLEKILATLQGEFGSPGWIAKIENRVDRAEHTLKLVYKIAIWIISIFSLAVFSFIGGLLTGVINVTYK